VDERLSRFDGIIKRNEQADLYRHSVVKRNNAQGMHGLQEGARERGVYCRVTALKLIPCTTVVLYGCTALQFCDNSRQMFLNAFAAAKPA
jgi:hypothetical protein